MIVLQHKRWVLSAVLVAMAALSAGCATGPNANPKDPLEPMNRSVTKFNDVLDDNVLKPVATGYRDYTPQPVQTGVSNFFRNLSDVWSTANNGLQLKGRDTAESLMRVVVNTTLGIYGLFDVATQIGLERHPEDFGQTLGYWGVPSGPYVVLPLLGPSTVRDTSVVPVETSVDLVRQYDDVPVRNAAMATRIVDKRASLLKTTDLLTGAAIDKYSFTRDSYLQFRRNQVYDGNPPDEDELVDPSAEPVAPSAK
ncbi:ABC transporter [Limnohabitans sp. TS-CS-82]|jgi:phospholipid-binding lipoprotein MlaA|uniref:MlaA family lipoprotein n=1 Tax=Limnohabitans sp. TS-CS-82 TaxID=2094193 RepID=UPI000CF2425B|nr:VacJ family lipoprotein [Limnohabitans sp. TS-CS-82]PQA85175.1 ABC transporter [Limnohabitans sp. TS-CS-82]